MEDLNASDALLSEYEDQYRCFLLEVIASAKAAIAAGQFYSQEEAERLIDEWTPAGASPKVASSPI